MTPPAEVCHFWSEEASCLFEVPRRGKGFQSVSGDAFLYPVAVVPVQRLVGVFDVDAGVSDCMLWPAFVDARGVLRGYRVVEPGEEFAGLPRTSRIRGNAKKGLHGFVLVSEHDWYPVAACYREEDWG